MLPDRHASNRGNGRVVRFDTATGAPTGWVGLVNDSPTDGGACGLLTSLQFTPGWCRGGTSRNSLDVSKSLLVSGYLDQPYGIKAAGAYVYVNDGERILRFAAASGAPSGWIGTVRIVPTCGAGCTSTAVGAATPGWCVGGVGETAPTGGDPGCVNTAAGRLTPGWCVGGTPGKGDTGDDQDLGPIAPDGIAIDSAHNVMYLFDAQSWRLVKMAL